MFPFQCMCYCLEFQFDSVITDRTLVLQRLLLLQASLPKVTVFSWEFFLNRFDTLCLEAQLDLESTGEVNSFTGRDFTNWYTKLDIAVVVLN